MEQTLAVVGSRTLKDYDLLVCYLNEYFHASCSNYTSIISGGAEGTDKLAEKYATLNKIPIEIIKPDYNKYSGKVAPIMRNKVIVENASNIICFWDLSSKGTRSVIDYAVSLNRPIIIIPFKA